MSEHPPHKNGPELWDRLLKLVRPIFGDDAVIAGGCIRDWRMGLPVKDIDVFVNPYGKHVGANDYDLFSYDYVNFETLLSELNNTTGDDTFGLEDQSEAMHGKPEHDEYEVWSEGQLRGLAEGLWTIWTDQGIDTEWTVNIIGRTDLDNGALNLVQAFDMGIVQAYYTGAEVIYTRAAELDFQQRTATIQSETQRKRAIQRFDRFNKRNPGKLRLVEIKEDTFEPA
jgi:hypothetical protein